MLEFPYRPELPEVFVETFKEIHRRAAKRYGGARVLEAELPKARTKAALRRIKDDRVLAEMTRGVFQAGFVWRIVENKWDGFEAAFRGFEPRPLARLSENKLAALAKDERIIRNPQKIRSVRENARFICELADEHGSAGRFFAAWPQGVEEKRKRLKEVCRSTYPGVSSSDPNPGT